jgi:hypothetical protein
MKPRAKARLSTRPSLPKISEEMRRWCDFLLEEIRSWPQVTTRPMFGMAALYRHDAIFGVIPRTRAMETPTSVGFKLTRPGPSLKKALQKDPRIVLPGSKPAFWISFELTSEHDLADALLWFERAYREAGRGPHPA